MSRAGSAVGLWGWGWCFPLLALTLPWPAPASAEALAADLTSHLIAITTGFTGASVVLFGAIDGPGDVAVVVRGPDREMTVRRKSRVAGIWMNSQEITFGNVPSFYFVAASRPL
jgi:Putative transmembrane protein (Alph_Pro_TM)